MNKNESNPSVEDPRLQLSEDQRFQFLIAQMNERYQAWHHMRERSMQFALWIMGLSIAASWHLLQEPCSGAPQRLAVTALVLSLGCAAGYFLKSLACGVRANREALINIETALGSHAQGVFLAGKAILPPEYKDTRVRPSSHFLTLYVLLAVTALYLLAAIWIPALFAPRICREQDASFCLCLDADMPPASAISNASIDSIKEGGPR